jgi:hypothetical protein
VNLRSLDIPTLRAAWWTHRALRRIHDDLRRRGLHYGPTKAPPPLPPHAGRGVAAILRRRPATCLERALVLQRWAQSQGQDRDVIVAVRGPSVDFAAHAWLDGDADGQASSFQELMRLPPR